MYKINLENKKVDSLEIVNFGDLSVKERFDIEEWVKIILIS